MARAVALAFKKAIADPLVLLDSRSFGISNESVNIPDIIHHICQSFSTLPSNFPPRWVCLKIRWPQNYCFHFPCVDFQARPGFHFLSCLVNLSIYGKRSSNRLKCPSKSSRGAMSPANSRPISSHQVVPGHPRSRLPTNWHAFHCHWFPQRAFRGTRPAGPTSVLLGSWPGKSYGAKWQMASGTITNNG